MSAGYGRVANNDDEDSTAHFQGPPLSATLNTSASHSSNMDVIFERVSLEVPSGSGSGNPTSVLRPGIPVGSQIDGVFGRLSKLSRPAQIPSSSISGNPNNAAVIESTNTASANQSSEVKVFEEIEPPSYIDAVQESTPPYFETTVITTFDGEGDVLVEGFPVGNYFVFFTNMIISMSFDFIGFLLTALLSTSHAAKHGARAGLGVTLVRYGLYIQTQDVDDEMAQYKYYNPDDNETREEVIEQNNWTAYLFIIIGFFLIAKANAEFVRVRRVRAVILAGTELENA